MTIPGSDFEITLEEVKKGHLKMYAKFLPKWKREDIINNGD
jgi:hypothetical protein